ncbi:GNAT family N-acetyltransferase [Nocardia caishijiensis]|uniref:FR47-like protein n=1 Tax=Nocardia caishijiensis TaxID=184756 RepID=A0ABQ6YLA9_9NOCA|nr:GNAT family N-acetyltransferase [Nocardia caishijiensis]KAF0846226.1 FR47-like protein [Nocardia caishijiensis]
MRIDITGDAARFLPEAEALLRRDALRNTVIASSVVNQIDRNFAGTRFLAVRDDEVVGLAQCTDDGRAYLGDLPADSLPAVVDTLVERVENLRSVEGSSAEVDGFLTHWAVAHAGTHRLDYTARLHRLETLRPPTVPGAARPATADDVALCLDWFADFDREIGAAPRALDEERALRLIERGWWWLWEVDGAPRSFVARQTEVFGWARIGPVYTPVGLRGNGYASALTAAVSAVIRADGADVCLFTDLANPTSNKIYESIGFRPVRDFPNYELTR